MTALLPNPQQPRAATASPPAPDPRQEAATAFLSDVEEVLAKAAAEAAQTPTATSYRDPSPVPAIGTAPPVPQPGRAAMSQKAVDYTACMLGASVVIGMTGAAGTGIMWASGHADAEVIAWVCGAPIGLAVPILALSSLVKRIKQAVEAAPAEQHHHYNGPVHQDNSATHHTTRAVWAKNTYHPR
jgi:hypothetical protein